MKHQTINRGIVYRPRKQKHNMVICRSRIKGGMGLTGPEFYAHLDCARLIVFSTLWEAKIYLGACDIASARIALALQRKEKPSARRFHNMIQARIKQLAAEPMQEAA